MIEIIRTYIFGSPLEDNYLHKWPAEEKKLHINAIKICTKIHLLVIFYESVASACEQQVVLYNGILYNNFVILNIK